MMMMMFHPPLRPHPLPPNEHVRLLILVRLVNSGPVFLKQKSWSVKAEKLEESGKVYWHHFKMVPPPAAAAADVPDRASTLKPLSQFAPLPPTQATQVQIFPMHMLAVCTNRFRLVHFKNTIYQSINGLPF
jgi:hypothetical protein